MTTRKFVLAAFATAAVLASGLAQARSPVDVQWQVTIGSPVSGYPMHGGVVVSAPVYLPPPVLVVPRYQPQYEPQYQPHYQPQYEPQYQPHYQPHYQPRYQPRPAPYCEPTRWDVDGDGIPNRYDRVYNPRWDRDGDGIPNRYERGSRYDHGRDHHDRRDDRRDWRQDNRR